MAHDIANLENLKSAKRNSVGKIHVFFSAAIHRCFLSVSYHHGRRRHSAAFLNTLSPASPSSYPQLLYLLTSFLVRIR
jgi:hypothetical protein